MTTIRWADVKSEMLASGKLSQSRLDQINRDVMREVFKIFGVPIRSVEAWSTEIARADIRDTNGMWSRGFASGSLLPYHFVRFTKGCQPPNGVEGVEVSYDGAAWRPYEPRRDRGIGAKRVEVDGEKAAS